MHGIIVICNRSFFSVIEELFSKVTVIDPKVIYNSLFLFYYKLLQTYKISGLFAFIPTASNCKQCTDNGWAIIQTT